MNNTIIIKGGVSFENDCIDNILKPKYNVEELHIPGITEMENSHNQFWINGTDLISFTVEDYSSYSIDYYIYDLNYVPLKRDKGYNPEHETNPTMTFEIDFATFELGEYIVKLLDKRGAELNFLITKIYE